MHCCRTSCLACFHSGDPDQVVPFALYTVLLYTHTHTSAVISARRSLSPASVSDFCFKCCSVHFIGYNFHSTFCLRFRLEINSFLQIQFSVGSKQRATTMLDFEHVFVALSFLVVRLHSLALFALAFFVSVTFQPIDFCSVPNLQNFHQLVQSFALQWLPISTLRGTSAQQTFGLCQLSLILKT